MTRVKQVLVIGLAFIAVGLVSLGIAISRDEPCKADGDGQAVSNEPRIKAVLSRCYGGPDVLTLEEVAKPTPVDNQVLVKVHAAALNPLDWHSMRGKPYVMRLGAGFGVPDDIGVGVDFAGTVEAVGPGVTRFKPGDEVFGGRGGSLAEYVTVSEDRAIVHKPANVSFEQAAAVPIAAITALQGLRDVGQIKAGHKVLINGASGGVGTFAVQIAKSFGAEVTAVCSTRNVELVKSLGADHIVDYTREDFTQSDQRYDLILDNVGNHSMMSYRRVMTPEAILVIVGGPSHDPWLGPVWQMLKGLMFSPLVSQKFAVFLADLNATDLAVIGDLMQQGKVTPVIDRRYPLTRAAEAMSYLEEGRARGKVIVNLE
jgi:NADPH:quinone reductase-like Zn-dependent oxidoreductase